MLASLFFNRSSQIRFRAQPETMSTSIDEDLLNRLPVRWRAGQLRDLYRTAFTLVVGLQIAVASHSN